MDDSETRREQLRALLLGGDLAELHEVARTWHPADLAEVLAELPPADIWRVLSPLAAERRAEVFSHLSLEGQVALARFLSRTELAAIVTHMSADERADLYNRLAPDEREALLPALSQAEREDIRRLAAYREGTAGAIMTSEYATLTADLTAREALETLRREAPDKGVATRRKSLRRQNAASSSRP